MSIFNSGLLRKISSISDSISEYSEKSSKELQIAKGVYPIYAEGVEYEEVEVGYTFGGPTYQTTSKEDSFLRIGTFNSSGARACFESAKAVSLNNVDTIIVDMSFSEDTVNESAVGQFFSLSIAKSPKQDYHEEYVAREIVRLDDHMTLGEYQRVTLDVSGFHGEYYIVVGARTGDTADETVINIKGIYLSQVKDTSLGESSLRELRLSRGSSPVYAEGVEYENVVGGIRFGNNARSKEPDHLRIRVAGIFARSSYETESPISLSGVQKITASVSFSNETIGTTGSFSLSIAKSPKQDYHEEYVAREIVRLDDHMTLGEYQRVTLDVSGFHGEYYIVVGALSESEPLPTVIEVRDIVLESEEDKRSEISVINPETGGHVNLTPVKDPQTGLWYLGTASVGHVAYDLINDKYQVDARVAAELVSEQEIDHSLRSWYVVGMNAGRFDSEQIAPIDISRASSITAVFRNTQDVGISLRCGFLKDQETYGQPVIANEFIDELDWGDGDTYRVIPAGDSYTLQSFKYPQMVAAYPAMAFRVQRSGIPTEGNVQIKVFIK